MPGLKGTEVEKLYETGADWLAGKSITWAGHNVGGSVGGSDPSG